MKFFLIILLMLFVLCGCPNTVSKPVGSYVDLNKAIATDDKGCLYTVHVTDDHVYNGSVKVNYVPFPAEEVSTCNPTHMHVVLP